MTRLTNADFPTIDEVFSIRIVLLSAGQPIVCPNGHWICDVIEDILGREAPRIETFTNWQKPSYVPEIGGRAPVCHVCGTDPWRTPLGQLRPWGPQGYRVFPGEPGYVTGGPDVQYSRG